jgi:hypothetical protein
MWPEGGEKIIIPWHEASLFVPPNRWFHQHFNIGGAPARYLAIHPPRGLSGISEKVEDRARDQIEYPDEDPMIRERFESELGRRVWHRSCLTRLTKTETMNGTTRKNSQVKVNRS